MAEKKRSSPDNIVCIDLTSDDEDTQNLKSIKKRLKSDETPGAIKKVKTENSLHSYPKNAPPAAAAAAAASGDEEVQVVDKARYLYGKSTYEPCSRKQLEERRRRYRSRWYFESRSPSSHASALYGKALPERH